MLNATEFDLKTGQVLTESDSDTPALGQRRNKVQTIEHSYLEQWFAHHGLEPPELFVAQLYPGVTAADQERLAQEGKVLFSTHGAKGYFTDRETAALIGKGDPAREIEPVYAADGNSAHNAVAYGSLMLSDGKTSQVLENESGLPVRILVVDDEQRDVGEQPLFNFKTEQPLTSSQLDQLLDRMGDGTMLVSELVMNQLRLESDVTAFLKEKLASATPEEITDLSTHCLEQGSFEGTSLSSAAVRSLDKKLEKTLNQRVVQFRAATPDYPGMAKGTFTVSAQLEELGLDAVISRNCIKGDDGRFSTPGIHEVERFWLNRKTDARHRTQVVGPQVKGTIPLATANELNPKAKERLEALNQAVTDPHQLAQAYVKAQQAQRLVKKQWTEKSDWLATVLEADPYGTLERFPSVVDRLENWVRGERVEIALRGNAIPSAMAQHHAQLKPWEVCHPRLPDGAVVAFYRSPFPNAGAAALAINNHAALREVDDEAFKKQGVAYLNPWTAKQIAITDFDGDTNGFFVGYQAKAGGQLPTQLRRQLLALERQRPAVQYEAARATFARWIEQQAQGLEQSPLMPADYPQVVRAFVERNAPENKPPAITKQPKIKHPWNREQERVDQAIWRAWEVTANNQIGRVANAGMVLQSFANECAYGQKDRAGLAGQVSDAYRHLLNRVDRGELDLPSDPQLQAHGLPGLNLRTRLERIAGGDLSTDQTLSETHDLLMDMANGPVALNLQTAVDIAKSSRGIDEGLHELARALQYKPHELRADRKSSRVYTEGRVFKVNTDEPTAWMAETVNESYKATQLPRVEQKIASAFGPLVSGEFAPEQAQQAQQLCDHYYNLVQEYNDAKQQLRDRSPRALAQPSLELTSANSGKTVEVERLIDGLNDPDFDWRVAGQTDWQVVIRPDNSGGFVVVQQRPQGEKRLGWVNPVNAQESGVAQALQHRSQLVLNQPQARLKPPAFLENDWDEVGKRPQLYLEAVAESLNPHQRKTLAAALWQTNIQRPGQKRARMGINLAMRMFPEEVAEQFEQGPPRVYVSRSSELDRLPQGSFTAQIQPVMEPNKAGQLVERQAVVQQDGGESVRLGLLPIRGVQFANHIEVQASLVESEVQGAQVLATQPGGEKIAVAKVKQFDFAETPFQGQSAQLQLQASSELIWVKVIQAGEPNKTLGYLDNRTRAGRAAGEQFWQQQGMNPWTSTLNRKLYTKLELQVEGPAEREGRSQQQALISPSYSQLQQWWQMAHAQGQSGLEAEVKGMGQKLVEVWQDQGNREPPPLNFRSDEVRLQPPQAKQMELALRWRQQHLPRFSPSYQELQELWRQAGKVGNHPLQEKVTQLGKQLVAAFQYEQGRPGKPGADYRSRDVQLAVLERQRIYRERPARSVGKKCGADREY